MKITLEVLKEKGASELDIKCFEKFCLYSSNKNIKEFKPVQLVQQGFNQDVLSCFNSSLVYKSIDTLEELKEVVDWEIYADWDGAEYRETLCQTFKYCPQLYKQDLKLFKKAVEHHVNNDFGFKYIFEYCGEVLELLPELHKKLRELNLIKQSCFDVKNDIRKILNSL
jgi:hypothetical protein